MDMAKLSEAMVAGLKAIAATPGARVRPKTMDALRSRFMITDGPNGAEITRTGEDTLADLDRREAAAKAEAERLSRPVPATAFVEPSAATAPVWGVDHEDEPEDEATECPFCSETLACTECAPDDTGNEPAVPKAWIEQLVTLLNAGGRIVKRDQGWRVDQRPGSLADAFLYQWDRVDAAANQAIILGIAEALPPTPGQGVIRLALKR